MTKVKAVGVHRVRRKLADGSERIYYYAWRGGPSMEKTPDDGRAFMAEYCQLTREREDDRASKTRNIAWLIREYVQSPQYRNLRDVTRKDYERHILEIEKEYHDLPLKLIGAQGNRADFIAFRDRFAETPRRADLVMAVLRRILSFAEDRELIERNPIRRVSEIGHGDRRDIIWSDAQIATFKKYAPEHMTRALILALWTGQRQGDLLKLTWGAFDGSHIRLRQSKTRRHVRVKASDELKAVLSKAKAANEGQDVPAATILTNAKGKPWSSGFKGMWGKTVAAAGIEGVRFHDLRGTFCTTAYRNGATFKEIAEASGHAEAEAERIIRLHYLAGDSVIEKIEAGTRL